MTQKPAQATMSLVERGYAVTWHEPRRAPYAGTLALGPTSLRFEGAARHGRTLGQTIFFRDLVDVRIAPPRPRGGNPGPPPPPPLPGRGGTPPVPPTPPPHAHRPKVGP